MKIPDVGFVACRECWQCRETKVDDWVGRNIAESKTAKAAHVVTLTYGQDQTTGDIDHIKAAVLTYSDVQKYLKYLRADGFPVRYFVVGEYGSLKGRAHWHIILYWQGAVPDHVIRENFMQKHWPHGWSYWDKCSPEAIRYACKYLLKDPADPDKQGWGPMPSKKPPLGDEYFRRLADQYVEQGLSPQHLFYSFPEVRRIPHGPPTSTKSAIIATARPVQFRLSGKPAYNFLTYFEDRWEEVYGSAPPKSELLLALNRPASKDTGFEPFLRENGFDPATIALDDRRAYMSKYVEKNYTFHTTPFPGRVPVPVHPPFEGAKVQFCEFANCYFTDTAGQRLWFSKDKEGDTGWHVERAPKLHDPYNMQRIWRIAGFAPYVPKLDPMDW